MLAHCVAEQMDWRQASVCVQHLGTRVARGPEECASEYGRMLDAWTASSRALPTPRRLAESARAARAAQLRERVAARESLLSRLRSVAESVEWDPGVARLVEACAREPETARLAAREGGASPAAWRDELVDEDEGFGPFAGRPPKVRRREEEEEERGGVEERREAVPFWCEVAMPRKVGPPLVPARKKSGATVAADSTFLLSVFESVAGSKHAGPFQEKVTSALYLEAIRQPVCLADVRSMLHEEKIVTAEELMRQLLLMTSNALAFNPVGSEVYLAAQNMQECIRRECEPLLVIGVLQELKREP